MLKGKGCKVISSCLIIISVLNLTFVSYASEPMDSTWEEVNEPVEESEKKEQIINTWIGSISNNDRAYLDNNGQKVVGLKNIGDKNYYFNEDGILQTGWQNIEETDYFFSLVNGERYENRIEVIDGTEYSFDAWGKCKSINSNNIAAKPDVDDINNKTVNNKDNSVGEKDKENYNQDNNPKGAESNAIKKNPGWVEENGKKYYRMPDGSLRIGWLKFGDIYYYCGSDGAVVKGFQKIGGRLYYFDGEGVRQKGWIEENGKKYYGMPDGSLRIGWLKFGDIYYYCGSDGAIVTSTPKTVNGVCYYFNDKGVRSRASSGWQTFGKNTYYGMPDGTFRMGWLKFGSTYYYCGSDGFILKGLQTIGGTKYYFDDSGIRQTGWIEVDGRNTYYAMPDGRIRVGWLKFGSTYYYCGSDGVVIHGMPRTINGVCYYFDENGIRSKAPQGWQTFGKNVYYGMPDGTFRIGWLKFGDTYYYCGNNGAILKGLQKINSNIYYFNDDGVRQKGWIEAGGKRYYGMPNGSLRIGWLKFGDTYYYCNKKAEIVTGDYVVYGILYTFDSKGIMKKKAGWGQYNGLKYYFNPATGFPYKSQWISFGATRYYANCNGFMMSGWQNIGGKYYYFYPNTNIMARNTTIDGYVIGANGVRVPTVLSKMTTRAWGYSSITPYLILVDRASHKVGVFKGRQGDWSNLYFWDCGDGAPSTPTVSGIFKVGIKGYYFDSGSARCFWYTQFYGNYLFHTVLCYKDGRIMDGRVGMALSHGCVRLQIPNAKWIYDNIPKGTTVVVY